MKNKLLYIIISLLYASQLCSQKSIKIGDIFILSESSQQKSVNKFDGNEIIQLKSFQTDLEEICATNEIDKIAILNKKSGLIKIQGIFDNSIDSIRIPYKIIPQTIYLDSKNLIVGGMIEDEMLIQYNLTEQKWYNLYIPEEIAFTGKAIEDFIKKDSTLIAIDNIVIPKFILFYNLNSKGEIEYIKSKELKTNGAYETISEGRITNKYLGLISTTSNGNSLTSHLLTFYNDLNLKCSFALRSNQKDSDYHTFDDFIIIEDKVFIASQEKGLGVFEIKRSYFNKHDSYRNKMSNYRLSASRIKYKRFKNHEVVKLTVLPTLNNFVITLKDENNNYSHIIN